MTWIIVFGGGEWHRRLNACREENTIIMLVVVWGEVGGGMLRRDNMAVQSLHLLPEKHDMCKQGPKLEGFIG